MTISYSCCQKIIFIFFLRTTNVFYIYRLELSFSLQLSFNFFIFSAPPLPYMWKCHSQAWRKMEGDGNGFVMTQHQPFLQIRPCFIFYLSPQLVQRLSQVGPIQCKSRVFHLQKDPSGPVQCGGTLVVDPEIKVLHSLVQTSNDCQYTVWL